MAKRGSSGGRRRSDTNSKGRAAPRGRREPRLTPAQRAEAIQQLLLQRAMLRDLLAQAEAGLRRLGAEKAKLPSLTKPAHRPRDAAAVPEPGRIGATGVEALRLIGAKGRSERQLAGAWKKAGHATPLAPLLDALSAEGLIARDRETDRVMRVAPSQPESEQFPIEYRSALVGGVARHLGAVVDGRDCPGVGKKFNLQFGPELFPLPVGRIFSFPKWTSPDFEASALITAEQCRRLYELHQRRYPAPYLLTGPNSNSGVRDTLKDAGVALPPLRNPEVFFWGLTTDPGLDLQGS